MAMLIESKEEAAALLAATVKEQAVVDSLPWVEKYRPNSLEELIAHEEIINILNKLIESNKVCALTLLSKSIFLIS